jgi:hypothetical protein
MTPFSNAKNGLALMADLLRGCGICTYVHIPRPGVKRKIRDSRLTAPRRGYPIKANDGARRRGGRNKQSGRCSTDRANCNKGIGDLIN